MIATITDRVTRPGFYGSENLYDYFVVENPSAEYMAFRRMELPCADFPRGVRAGDRVRLDYVAVASGYRWHPVRLMEAA